MKIPGNKTIYGSKLFQRDRYVLPNHLINKNNVFINVDENTDNINISFSEEILKEFSHWSRKRVNDLMHDLKAGICFFFVHEPWNANNRDELYKHIFVTLHQIY